MNVDMRVFSCLLVAISADAVIFRPSLVGAMMRDNTGDDDARELSWLKEPDPDTEFDIEERGPGPRFGHSGAISGVVPEPAVPPRPRRPDGASGATATPPDSAATTLGKGMRDIDLELQPLGAGDGQGASAWTGRPKQPLYKVWPSRSKFYCKGIFGEAWGGSAPGVSVRGLWGVVQKFISEAAFAPKMWTNLAIALTL